MPRLSDSMEEGTVAKWLVAVGHDVREGQPLVEIETDKATVIYEAESSGTLLEVLIEEGDSAALGAPIARIGAAGEKPVSADDARAAASETKGPPPDEDAGAPDPPSAPAARPDEALPPRASRRGNVSPVARRLADKLGVDLASVTGTGPSGMVTRADIEAAAQADRARGAPVAISEAPAGGRVTALTRLQRTIARRMVEGAAAPTFSIDMDVDMTEAIAVRASLGGGSERTASLNDFIVKAAALALTDFPRVNGSYTDEGFVLRDHVNVGIAVATEDGLFVPVVRDADAKPLAAIAADTRELARKVRDRTIRPNELDGGTFTVTNLGMLGVRSFVPILNPPEAAILSVGAASTRPAPVDEPTGASGRETAILTLVCDHRIVYGAEAARFLARVRELLEEPGELAR